MPLHTPRVVYNSLTLTSHSGECIGALTSTAECRPISTTYKCNAKCSGGPHVATEKAPRCASRAGTELRSSAKLPSAGKHAARTTMQGWQFLAGAYRNQSDAQSCSVL